MKNVKEIRLILMEIRHELNGKIEDSVIQKLDEAIEALEVINPQQSKYDLLPYLDLVLRSIPSVSELLKKVQQFIE